MKKVIVIFLIVFACQILLLFYNNAKSNESYYKLDNNYFSFSKFNNYKMKKILIVGDSRMFNIQKKSEMFNIPENVSFHSKNGATISFLQGEDEYIFLDKLNAMKKNEENYVIFNLGVNDLNNRDMNVNKIATQYLRIYESFVRKYNRIKFVFLSVNPVIEDKIGYDKFVTNKNITKFNYYMQKFIQNLHYDNFTFLNSYNNIEFDSYDGVHYTLETDKKILKYIITMI